LAGGAVLGFIAFFFWELKTPKPIVNLRVLLDRNLAVPWEECYRIQLF
jgi:hypothetical protein